MEPAEPGPGAGAGPAQGAEEIDMSLDDIIKRHRKGQTDAKVVGDRRRQQVKNRNSAYGNGRPRFRTWMQRNLPGPSRFRRGFGQPQYYRRQFRSAIIGPGRRATSTLNGVSPLKRQASAQEGNQNDEVLTKSSDSGQPEAQRRLPQHLKRFRTAGVTGQGPARRPFTLNRRPVFQQKQIQQRQSKVNFNRGASNSMSTRQQSSQPGAGSLTTVPGKIMEQVFKESILRHLEERKVIRNSQRGFYDEHTEAKTPWMRSRWRLQPSSGAVLTISVSNPQASPTDLPGGKRPFQRGRRPPPKTAKPQPRGVPLRFNFRAMANQTSLTLDERFSSLRNKRHFTAARNSGRTVMLP